MTEDIFKELDAQPEPEINLDFGEPDQPAPEIELNLDFGEDEVVSEPEIDLSFGEGMDDEDGSADEEAAQEPGEYSDEEKEALEQLHDRLTSSVGDWYVVHTYSGMENRVRQNLENRIKALGMEDYIHEIVVPTEDVVETRSGAKKSVTRTILPGYVLVRMELTDASWSAVRHTPSVTGFVAHASHPVPLTLEEVEKMLAPAALAKVQGSATGPKKREKGKPSDFNVGDSVMVTHGAFAGIHATITEIDAKRDRLRALVEILGRETPVDLTFTQIQKID